MEHILVACGEELRGSFSVLQQEGFHVDDHNVSEMGARSIHARAKDAFFEVSVQAGMPGRDGC